MKRDLESMVLDWRGGTSPSCIAESLEDARQSGVYLLVENSAEEGDAIGHEMWYFGEASNVAHRIETHLDRHLFFGYWAHDFKDVAGRNRIDQLSHPENALAYCKDPENYRSLVTQQIELRIEVIRRHRIYWAPVSADLRKRVERTLIDWLRFDGDTAEPPIRSGNARRGSGSRIAVENRLERFQPDASITKLPMHIPALSE